MFLGTSADIMKVGGYKLSALEIESTLLEVTLTSVLSFIFWVIEGIISSSVNQEKLILN